jgi:peptidyl-prolyl cis-trans isomerase C
MHSLTPRLLLATLLGLAVPSVSVVALAQTGASAAAKVNGVTIPKSRVDFFVKSQVAQGQSDSPDLRKAVTNELVLREVIAQEASKKGLAKDPEVQAQMEIVRQNVLANAYRQDFVKHHPVTDAQLKAEYDKVKSEMGDKEYKVRHILVDSEATAQDIIARLKKGEKFADLAKQSKDPGSKDKGGELEWSPPAAFVKPFSDAMVALQKGQYTEKPVQTKFGYHVIELDDVRATQFPPFDEVKAGLAKRLEAQAFEKNVAELRKKAKVE